MTIGSSLLLIAVGAILKWAVTAHVEGVNLQNMGVILMVVGGVGLCIGLFMLFRVRWTAGADPRPPEPPRP
jgi:Flp pilus assembly protein protease CpaA